MEKRFKDFDLRVDILRLHDAFLGSVRSSKGEILDAIVIPVRKNNITLDKLKNRAYLNLSATARKRNKDGGDTHYIQMMGKVGDNVHDVGMFPILGHMSPREVVEREERECTMTLL